MARAGIHGRRSRARWLLAGLVALATCAGFPPTQARAAARRPRDGRWVGGLVLGITGTAAAVGTLDLLLFTHTCFASGGCAPGVSPSSSSSAWPYVGVAAAFATAGIVGWYVFATPTEPAPHAYAAVGDLASPPKPVAGFGVMPIAGGARATVYFAF